MEVQQEAFWDDGEIELFVLRSGNVGPDYVAWLNEPEINRYLESRFVQHTLETTREYVTSMLDSPNNLMLGIRHHALDMHVGNIKLGPFDKTHGLGEIGLMIGARELWGRGIATRAISIITEIGLRQIGLRKVTAGCYRSNRGSQIAFERAGFHVEGMRSAHFLLDGVPEDLVLLARFAENGLQAEPVAI